MTSDQNKHIEIIQYNHLNLPTVIQFENGKSIAYTYDAAGSKLTKDVNYGNYHVTTTYMDGYQYEEKPLAQGGAGEPQLLFFPTAEGYVKAVYEEQYPFGGARFQFIYNYTDHLGNIRLSYTKFRDDIVKLEETHYYPFGLKHGNYYSTAYIKLAKKEANEVVPQNLLDGNLKIKPTTDRAYKYKYQGQERQEELNLNWDSFKYRNYDYAIGRFMSIDPLTEEYNTWSPYVFSGNRVLDARELEGLEPHTIHKTLIDAAINFGEQYNGLSIRASREIATRFYSGKDKRGNTFYSYTKPMIGATGFSDPKASENIPKNSELVANAHTHGSDTNTEIEGDKYEGNNFPSHETDLKKPFVNYLKTGKDIKDIVITPNGSLFIFTPSDSKKTKTHEDAVKEVIPANKVIPSDPDSKTRKNKISPNNSPKILPKGIDKDNYPKK